MYINNVFCSLLSFHVRAHQVTTFFHTMLPVTAVSPRKLPRAFVFRLTCPSSSGGTASDKLGYRP